MSIKNRGLKGLFLTHTAPAALMPFRSIMDMSREEADSLTAQFTGKATERASYYDHRKDVESWLRSSAEAAGIRIENRNPVYFSLTAKAADDLLNPDLRTISIPANTIDLSTCSFTIDDSFSNHRFVETQGADAYGIAPHPMLGAVFNADQVAKILKEKDMSGYLHPGKDSYIEVQMWARPKIPV